MAARFRASNITLEEVATRYHTPTFATAHNYQLHFFGSGNLTLAKARLQALDVVAIPKPGLFEGALEQLALLLGTKGLGQFCDVRHVHRLHLSAANLSKWSQKAVADADHLDLDLYMLALRRAKHDQVRLT